MIQLNNLCVLACVFCVSMTQGAQSLRNMNSAPYGTVITIKNFLGKTEIFNFKFLNPQLQGYQDISAYSAFCVPLPGGPPDYCSVKLGPNEQQAFVVESDKQMQASIVITVGVDNWPDGPCPVTNMELNLHGAPGAPDEDTIDVSYVNGYNYGVVVSNSVTQGLIIDASSSNLQTILNTPGVYPPGCDVCIPSSQNSAPIWPNCPATPYGGRMPSNMCKPAINGQPVTPCQLPYPTNSDYTIAFVPMTNV